VPAAAAAIFELGLRLKRPTIGYL